MGRWESWTCGYKSRRAISNLSQMQHPGERALHLTRVEQLNFTIE